MPRRTAWQILSACYRVYLKTVNTPKQRAFSTCWAPFFLVVKKESTKDDIHLDIFLKLDSTYEAVYTPLKHTAGITSLKTDDARGDFLWRTEETILSVRFGQIAGIC